MGIRDLRKQAGLTQQELADLVTQGGYPLARQTLSDIELGKTRPTGGLKDRIYEAIIAAEISQAAKHHTSDIKNRGVSPEAACKKYEDAGKLPVHRSAAALARKEDDAVVLTIDPALCHGGDMLANEPHSGWFGEETDTVDAAVWESLKPKPEEAPIAAVERQLQERYPSGKRHVPRIVQPRKSLWAQFRELVRG